MGLYQVHVQRCLHILFLNLSEKLDDSYIEILFEGIQTYYGTDSV